MFCVECVECRAHILTFSCVEWGLHALNVSCVECVECRVHKLNFVCVECGARNCTYVTSSRCINQKVAAGGNKLCVHSGIPAHF